MKKALFLGIALLASTASFASITSVTLVNHYSDDLIMTVDRYMEVVPDLQKEFVLNKHQQISTQVVPGADGQEMAYISVRPKQNSKKDAFFGISSRQVSGYLSLGIAYSWKNEEHTIVTFCRPKVYQRKGSC